MFTDNIVCFECVCVCVCVCVCACGTCVGECVRACVRACLYVTGVCVHVGVWVRVCVAWSYLEA